MSLCKIGITVFLLSAVISPLEGRLTITKECGEIVCQSHYYCSQVDHSCRPCQVACDPARGNYDKDTCEANCQDYLHDLLYMRKGENESDYRDQIYVSIYYKMQEDLRLLKILITIVIILSTVVILALFGIILYFRRIRKKLHEEGNTPFSRKAKKFADYPVIYSNSKVLSLPFPDVQNGPSSQVSSSLNNNMSRSTSPDLVSRTATATTTLASYNNHSIYNAPPSSISRAKSKSSKKDKSSANNSFVMENPAVITRGRGSGGKLRKEPSESTLPEYHAYDNPAMIPSPVHVHM